MLCWWVTTTLCSVNTEMSLVIINDNCAELVFKKIVHYNKDWHYMYLFTEK